MLRLQGCVAMPVVAVLENKPKALHLPGKHPTNRAASQPHFSTQDCILQRAFSHFLRPTFGCLLRSKDNASKSALTETENCVDRTLLLPLPLVGCSGSFDLCPLLPRPHGIVSASQEGVHSSSRWQSPQMAISHR